MRRSPVLIALVVAYPLIIYVLLSHHGPGLAAVALVVISVARLIGAQRRQALGQDVVLGAGGIVLGTAAWLYQLPAPVLLYPVMVNLALLVVFGLSVLRPPTVVERIARLRHTLDAAGVEYTRKVTLVWCAFFLFNGTMALATALFASIEVWTIYNGLVSYLLMGTLFVAEMMVRRRRVGVEAS